MTTDTNRRRGNAGLALAIAYYGSHGFTVSLPLNDTQDYDLLVDDGKQIFRIQAKFSSSITPSGKYQVSLRSNGGRDGRTYKTVKYSGADILFAVCDDMSLYEIPLGYLANAATIDLGGESGDEYERFRVSLED